MHPCLTPTNIRQNSTLRVFQALARWGSYWLWICVFFFLHPPTDGIYKQITVGNRICDFAAKSQFTCFALQAAASLFWQTTFIFSFDSMISSHKQKKTILSPLLQISCLNSPEITDKKQKDWRRKGRRGNYLNLLVGNVQSVDKECNLLYGLISAWRLAVVLLVCRETGRDSKLFDAD